MDIVLWIVVIILAMVALELDRQNQKGWALIFNALDLILFAYLLFLLTIPEVNHV